MSVNYEFYFEKLLSDELKRAQLLRQLGGVSTTGVETSKSFSNLTHSRRIAPQRCAKQRWTIAVADNKIKILLKR